MGDYPKMRPHDYTGWPCPRCDQAAWTGDRGCLSCGLTLQEAYVINEREKEKNKQKMERKEAEKREDYDVGRARELAKAKNTLPGTLNGIGEYCPYFTRAEQWEQYCRGLNYASSEQVALDMVRYGLMRDRDGYFREPGTRRRG